MPIPLRRLAAQQITRHDFARPAEVVAWLGAVQAQDWAGAKWAVGLRLPDGRATDEAIERAVDEGSLVRIHAFRWTWHLVAPRDVRWILAHVAPGLLRKFARRHRELGIDVETTKRSHAALAKALRGTHMTRAELARVLERARVSTTGPRLSHLLGMAELDAVVCSGARRGKQATWALLDERVAPSKTRDPRDAAAELARRYFRSRGPATLNDFRWWSGMAAAEARAALESVESKLSRETIDGSVHYWDAPIRAEASTGAHLLPPFDEYLVAYQNRDAVLAPEHVKRMNAGGGMLGACIVCDGRVVGIWRRTLGRAAVTVEQTLFGRAPAARTRAIGLAVERYAAFVGRAASRENV
jgi:hypothetical protein